MSRHSQSDRPPRKRNPRQDLALMRINQRSTKRRHARQQKFLEAIAEVGIVGIAARKVGIHRSSHTQWLADKDYAARYAETRTNFGECVLEHELLRRALVGEEQKVYYRGEVIDTIRKKSTAALFGMLKAFFPERYVDSVVAHSLNINVTALAQCGPMFAATDGTAKSAKGQTFTPTTLNFDLEKMIPPPGERQLSPYQRAMEERTDATLSGIDLADGKAAD